MVDWWLKYSRQELERMVAWKLESLEDSNYLIPRPASEAEPEKKGKGKRQASERTSERHQRRRTFGEVTTPHSGLHHPTEPMHSTYSRKAFYLGAADYPLRTIYPR